jgi:chemotaxis signal transduction protein
VADLPAAGAAGQPAGRGRWLQCTSRGETFGIDLAWVREILYQPTVLPLPTLTPPVVGLIQWRGQEVPALSLDQALGHGGGAAAPKALMLTVGAESLGLLVESVGETLAAGPEQQFGLDPSLADSLGLLTSAIKAGDELVFILNADRLGLLVAGR